jgi:hypothetical protein
METERAFPCCIACGARLTPSWLRVGLLRPKRWGYSLHFGGRGRIRRGVDHLVSSLQPDEVSRWLGRETAMAAAAAVFSATLALQQAGWSLPWVLAEARAIERLRFLEAAVSLYGEPQAVLTRERPRWVPQPVEDYRAKHVEVAPRAQGDVMDLEGGSFGDAMIEDKT